MEIMSGAGALGTNVEDRDAVRILGTSDYGVIGAAQPTNAKVSNMQTTSSSGAAAQPVSSMTVSSSTTTVSSSMTGAYQQSGIPVYQTPAPAQTNATVIPSRQTPLVPSIMIRSQESSRANSERMLTPPPRNPEIRTPAQATAPQGSSGGLLSLRYDSATVLNNRGVSLNTAGYYERAVLEYTDAIARNPNFAVAFNNRGVAYANLGQYDRALDDFNQALRLNPYYYDAMANREQVKVSLASR
jgi:hypothetical protein